MYSYSYTQSAMTTQNKRLQLKQLDKTLADFSALNNIHMPRKGWLRAIRNALNMSGPQFARRLGMTRAGVADLERREVSGSATLAALRSAADALDCVLVYAFVPRTSLQTMAEQQARRHVEQQQASVSHSMSLEDQGLSQQERREIINGRVEELLRTMPRSLWDNIHG